MIERELEDELAQITRSRHYRIQRDLLVVIDAKQKELEDMRLSVADMEGRMGELSGALDQERHERMGDLLKREEEIRRLHQEVAQEKDAIGRQVELERSVVVEYKKRIEAYKREIEKILEENRKAVLKLNEEINQRDGAIDKLHQKVHEIEAKASQAQAKAKADEAELARRLADLESSLAQERTSRARMEETARNALASSTGALLEERAKSQIVGAKVPELTLAVAKLEDEKRAILENWERERRKWEELWQRERSVWENQRSTFADWEAKYFKDKGLWERLIAEKEEKEIRLTKVFGNLVTELGRWVNKSGMAGSPKVTPMPPQFPDPLAEDEGGASKRVNESASRQEGDEGRASQRFRESTIKRTGRRLIEFLHRRRLLSALMAAAAFAGGIFGAWKAFVPPRPAPYIEAAAWELPLAAPSGIAAGAGVEPYFWLGDWKTGQILKVAGANPSFVIGRHEASSAFFHPNALAAGRDSLFLFSLDSVSRKIFKHRGDNPSIVVDEAPTPTASSLFLTLVDAQGEERGVGGKEQGARSNGGRQRLAVLDTIEKHVYLLDPETLTAKPSTTFKLPEDSQPMAIAGQGSSLWVWDARKALFIRFGPDDKGQWASRGAIEPKFTSKAVIPENLTAFLAADDGSFYAVIESEPSRLILLKPGPR